MSTTTTHETAAAPRTIAFLGMGEMGSRMVRHLITAGHEVRVWNRSEARARGVEGATVHRTPREAARGASIVIAMVRDDEAARSVWLDEEGGALLDMEEGSIAVESSTLSVSAIAQLAAHAASRSVRFFDAPVAGSLPQAEAARLIHLVGGDREVYERELLPVLSLMSGAQHHCGGVGAGAATKLAVNALFAAQVAVMAEALAFLAGHDLALEAAVELLSATPVCSPAAAQAAKMMASASHPPLFPAALVEKDLGYFMSEFKGLAEGASPEVIARVRERYEALVSRGGGGRHLTAIATLYLPTEA